MPDKLTDAEVKKALEEYINFADLEYINHTSIEVDILKNALDLINRQEEKLQEAEDTIQYADKEIKRLNAENEVLERRNTTLEKLAEHRKKAIFERVERNLELRKELKTANAEIESLKAEVENLRMVLDAVEDHIHPLPFETDFDKAINKAKTEAYKECVEVVKKLWGNYTAYEFEKKLDNLLNELVGDGDGKRKD